MEFNKNGEMVPETVARHLHVKTLYDVIDGGFIPVKGMRGKCFIASLAMHLFMGKTLSTPADL